MSEAARPICVLSFGRSGSSLATRALGLLGLDLGAPDAMLGADEWNRSGYWELEAMNELNDELLAALGGSLWDPPDPAPGWEAAPGMEPFRARAAALLAESFGPGRRMAFKDTRTVHTLALWRQVAGPMDYVICVRNPREVVDSLSRMLPLRGAADLYGVWLKANARALRQTAGERRLVLPYEAWFADPEAVARRLAAFVGADDEPATVQRIAGFFDRGLQSQRSGAAQLVAADVPVEAAAMHFLLRALAGAEGEDAAAVGEVAARLGDGLHLESALLGERDRAAAEREQLAAERDALAGDRTWLREQLAKVQQAHDDSVAYAGAREAERDAARAELAQTREELAAIVRSPSWRATAPLRAGARRLRGG